MTSSYFWIVCSLSQLGSSFTSMQPAFCATLREQEKSSFASGLQAFRFVLFRVLVIYSSCFLIFLYGLLQDGFALVAGYVNLKI